jgi:hypothetical protein
MQRVGAQTPQQTLQQMPQRSVLAGQGPVTSETAVLLGDLQQVTGALPSLSACGADPHGGASWCRSAARRSHRSPSSHLLLSSRAGSIPAADSFYLRHGEWHLVPRPPVHGTGQLAAPPRAPPR